MLLVDLWAGALTCASMDKQADNAAANVSTTFYNRFIAKKSQTPNLRMSRPNAYKVTKRLPPLYQYNKLYLNVWIVVSTVDE